MSCGSGLTPTGYGKKCPHLIAKVPDQGEVSPKQTSRLPGGVEVRAVKDAEESAEHVRSDVLLAVTPWRFGMLTAGFRLASSQ